MRVIGFGTYDLARHPRVGIVLDGLRAHGDDVLELNAPLGFSTAQRVAMLHRPWLAYRLALRLLARWTVLAWRSFGVRRGAPIDLVVVGYLGHFDVLLARLLFPRTRIALDMMIFAADTARDRGATGGMKLALLDLLDRAAVRVSDVVLVDTDEHVALLRPPATHKAVVVPVGAPDAWFAAGDAHRPRHDGPLHAVFFGLYTPLQGAVVLATALASLGPGIEVTMIGSGQDLDAARDAAAGNRNITWHDWIEPADLPRIVAAHDVCLGIFGATPKAQRVVPNKVFQGAAAGCAIVTSDTAPQRRALGDAACFVPAGDATAIAATLTALHGDRALLADLQVRARAVAEAAFRGSAIVVPLRAAVAELTRPGDSA